MVKFSQNKRSLQQTQNSFTAKIFVHTVILSQNYMYLEFESSHRD